MNPSSVEHYREILLGVDENPEREGLLDTPTARNQSDAVPVQWLHNESGGIDQWRIVRIAK